MSFRRGTLIVEPDPHGIGSEEYRIMLRIPGGIEHISDNLTARQACGMVMMALLRIDPWAEDAGDDPGSSSDRP